MSEIEKAKKLFDKWFRGRRDDEPPAQPEPPQPQPEEALDPRGDERAGDAGLQQEPRPPTEPASVPPGADAPVAPAPADLSQPAPIEGEVPAAWQSPQPDEALDPSTGLTRGSRGDERVGEASGDVSPDRFLQNPPHSEEFRPPLLRDGADAPPQDEGAERVEGPADFEGAPPQPQSDEALDPSSGLTRESRGDERVGEASGEVSPLPAEHSMMPPAPPVADARPAPPADAVAPLPAEEPAAPEAAPKANWFQRLKQGLTRSSNALTDNLTGLLRKRKLDDETLQDLEDVLIQADLGVETAMRITEALAESRYDKEITAEEVRAVLAAEVERVLAPVARPLQIERARKPHVVLVVGVNGSGKTTTIGKLAARFRSEGLSVVLGAGDTFRAAAIEQLKVWGTRAGAAVVAREQGADASGLAYDALARSKEENANVLILDTAGRLQNKAHLMAELEKIVRVLRKQDETAPHDVLLVLDATTGQNAMQQVEVFRQVCGVTGLAMTKLDGTARGGILVAIAAKHALPVHFIGVGEAVDDLQPFEAADFARAIAGRTT